MVGVRNYSPFLFFQARSSVLVGFVTAVVNNGCAPNSYYKGALCLEIDGDN